jgi:uncharacterized protein YoxC
MVMYMKKTVLMLATVAMLASCGDSDRQKAVVEGKLDSLQTVINQKDSEINDMMGAFNEIQDGFAQINAAEGRVNLYSENAEKNMDDLKENMEFIQKTMAENRKKIEELQVQLKKSGIKASKLQEAVSRLAEQMKAKDAKIAELHAQLAQKDVRIAELGDAITDLSAAKEQVEQQKNDAETIVHNQDIQLNTAWYVYGTKKELKDRKILVDGDVLKDGDFDKDYFTKIDIREMKVFPFGAKTAKVLTTHPADSYTLLKDSQGFYTLRVTDPTKFWSVSKYLVVRVK